MQVCENVEQGEVAVPHGDIFRRKTDSLDFFFALRINRAMNTVCEYIMFEDCVTHECFLCTSESLVLECRADP